jgi:drug/metabolite transporter (DMT)-like permease
LAFVGGILWFVFEREVPDLKTLFWIQLTSLMACVGLSMLAYALQQARPNVGQVGTMLYVQTPAAILLGWLLLGEKPSFSALIGATLIVGSGTLLALRKKSSA